MALAVSRNMLASPTCRDRALNCPSNRCTTRLLSSSACARRRLAASFSASAAFSCAPVPRPSNCSDRRLSPKLVSPLPTVPPAVNPGKRPARAITASAVSRSASAMARNTSSAATEPASTGTSDRPATPSRGRAAMAFNSASAVASASSCPAITSRISARRERRILRSDISDTPPLTRSDMIHSNRLISSSVRRSSARRSRACDASR